MPLRTLVFLAGAVGAAEALLLWVAGARLPTSLAAAAAGAVLWGAAAAAVHRRLGRFVIHGGTHARHRGRPGAASPTATSAARSLLWITRLRRHLGHGLSEPAAHRLAWAVLELTGAAAVAVSSRDRVLALAGPGDDCLRTGSPAACPILQRAVTTQRTVTALSRGELGRTRPSALVAAMAVPLRNRGEVVGALAVYFHRPGLPDRGLRRLVAAAGAGVNLLLEAADFERQAAEGARYRLHALRAQINPHFLYNVLTAVIVKVRTDPEEARRLLIRLADFFRYAVKTDAQLMPFSAELAFVRTYIHLERARFGDDRFRVVYDIDPQILTVPIPVLTVQPLVENAVKHGIVPKPGPGTVVVRAWTDFLSMRAYVEVRDDGVGMPLRRIRDAVRGGSAHNRIGLANIRQRLAHLYGDRAAMTVESHPRMGTRVRLSLPVVRDAEGPDTPHAGRQEVGRERAATALAGTDRR